MTDVTECHKMICKLWAELKLSSLATINKSRFVEKKMQRGEEFVRRIKKILCFGVVWQPEAQETVQG